MSELELPTDSGSNPTLELGPEPSGNDPKLVLRTRGLARSFGRVRAVEGLDLTVGEGEIYGFLGVNGAGKTTTIRMLMGILKPDSGTMELLGQATRRTSIQQKQRIGYVSQEQTFYPWMTCGALGRFVGGLYPTWDQGEFVRLLEVLEVPMDRRASQLSGGMRVKLALALALAPRPALLILDEPTAGLDPVARREFLDIIQRQARDHQRTTFFSSHLVDEVERVADRVGIIHAGRMRYEGDLKTLRETVRRVILPLSIEASLPPGAGAGGIIPVHGVEEATMVSHPEVMQDPSAAIASELVPAAVPPPLPAGHSFVPPPGFEVLRDESREGARTLVMRATAAAWAAFAHPGAEVRYLSLEDIFISMVGTVVGRV